MLEVSGSWEGNAACDGVCESLLGAYRGALHQQMVACCSVSKCNLSGKTCCVANIIDGHASGSQKYRRQSVASSRRFLLRLSAKTAPSGGCGTQAQGVLRNSRIMATEVLPVDELVSAEDTSWPDLCSVQGLRPSKRQRLEVLASRRVPLPPTYTANTLKEELCLEYVEHFRKQFVQLFPDRKPLFLVARNEAGVPKFVCSTLRPTQLPYKAIYDMHTAAAFVANYMEYEPLPHPLELPQFLPSPSTVLQWRAGDCFDFAMLLCSLLLGDGYDAYVVVGTAPRWITLRDLSHTRSKYKLPPLPEANRNTAAAYSAKGGLDVPDAPSTPLETPGSGASASLGKAPAAANKYLPKQKPALASKYLARMAQREAESQAAAQKNEYESDDDETHQTDLEVAALQADMPSTVRDDIREGDRLEGRRLHAWVLVRSGKRNVTDSTFIEPSTGEVYPLEESPYFSIESVFNNTNLWVNMQTQALVPQPPGAPPAPTSAAAVVAADARALFRKRREAAADATKEAEDQAGAAALAEKGGGAAQELTLEERLIAGDLSFLPGISEVKKHNPRAEELITGMPDIAPTASAAAAAAALPPVDLRAELAAVGLQLTENKEIAPLEEGEGGAAGAPPAAAVGGGGFDDAEGKEGKESESKDNTQSEEEEHVAGTGKEVSRLLSYDLSSPDDWEYVFVEQTLEELVRAYCLCLASPACMRGGLCTLQYLCHIICALIRLFFTGGHAGRKRRGGGKCRRQPSRFPRRRNTQWSPNRGRRRRQQV